MNDLRLVYPPGAALVNPIGLDALVGAVQAGGGGALVLDQFGTDESAPLASPRDAEPGPGAWTIVDTGANLVIDNNWLVVDGAVSWGDPSLWLSPALDGDDFGGVAMLVQRLGTTTTGPAILLGDDGQGYDPSGEGVGLYIDNYEVRMASTGAKVVASPERLGSIYYVLAIIRLPGGADLLLFSGGEYGTYPVATPLFLTEDSLTDVYVGWQSGGGASRTDWIQAIERTRLPAALQTRFGATLVGDDFDRADGDLDGSSPTNGSGTWDVWAGSMTITSGQAHPSTTGFCRARIDCGEAPRIVACTITTPSDVSNLEVYVELRDDGADRISVATDTTQTYVFSSYSNSTLGNNPATLPADTTFRMVVVDLGDRIRVYRDGTLLIDVETTDGQGETRVGFTTNSQSIFIDDFEAWPDAISLSAFATGRDVPAGSGTALLSDAFTDANGTALDTHDEAYTIVDGPFEIQSNAAVLSDGTDNGFALLDAGTDDHEVEAVITLPADNDDGFNCGLVVRYDGQGNYLFARYLNQGAGMSPEIELIESVGGQTEVVAFVNLGASAIPAGSTHTLRVAVRGREVAVYHNDKLVLQSETVVSGGTLCGIGRSGTVNVATPSWDDLAIRAT